MNPAVSILSDIGKERPSRTPSCPSEEIFMMFRRRQISHAEYIRMTAVDAANHPHWFQARRYTPMPQSLVGYVMGRPDGMSYDPDQARKLGKWTLANFRAHEENIADVSNLIWVKEQIHDTGLTDKMRQIDFLLDRYRANVFPQQDMQRARQVQVLDATARMIQ